MSPYLDPQTETEKVYKVRQKLMENYEPDKHVIDLLLSNTGPFMIKQSYYIQTSLLSTMIGLRSVALRLGLEGRNHLLFLTSLDLLLIYIHDSKQLRLC